MTESNAQCGIYIWRMGNKVDLKFLNGSLQIQCGFQLVKIDEKYKPKRSLEFCKLKNLRKIRNMLFTKQVDMY